MVKQDGLEGMGDANAKAKRKRTVPCKGITPVHISKEAVVSPQAQLNITGEIEFEKKKEAIIGTKEINDRASLPSYCPIPDYKIMRSIKNVLFRSATNI